MTNSRAIRDRIAVFAPNWPKISKFGDSHWQRCHPTTRCPSLEPTIGCERTSRVMALIFQPRPRAQHHERRPRERVRRRPVERFDGFTPRSVSCWLPDMPIGHESSPTQAGRSFFIRDDNVHDGIGRCFDGLRSSSHTFRAGCSDDVEMTFKLWIPTDLPRITLYNEPPVGPFPWTNRHSSHQRGLANR